MLIDVAFSEIRPSPWRQAVDLANMTLPIPIQRWSVRRLVLSAGVVGGLAITALLVEANIGRTGLL